jgi:hypothetical protein
MRKLFSSAALAVALVAPAKAQDERLELKVGDVVHVNRNAFACKHRVIHEDLARLLADSDYTAFNKAFAEKQHYGLCTILQRGQGVYIDKMSDFERSSNLLCVRLRGQPECLWIDKTALWME